MNGSLDHYTSQGGGNLVRSIVRPCSCSSLNNLQISAQEEELWCTSFSLLLHVFDSLAVNPCCLESRMTGTGLSRDSLINAPWEVGGNTPWMDLSCRLRTSSRSSRLPTAWGSHPLSLQYRATSRTQATWTYLTLSCTVPCILGRNRSLASAAMAFIIPRL
jgi:hypothetical protein